ncbi:MAG: hypothetical protein RBT80_13910 [Candidatus Vecturithrix sp.]|nr:hypothetical protein [Candidatus Vecturithrix sp.]
MITIRLMEAFVVAVSAAQNAKAFILMNVLKTLTRLLRTCEQ